MLQLNNVKWIKCMSIKRLNVCICCLSCLLPVYFSKRTGGIQLEGDDAPTNGETNTKPQDEYNKKLAKQIEQEKEEKKKEDEKQEADSLWSDFMKDVGGPKPKPKMSTGLGSLASLSEVPVMCLKFNYAKYASSLIFIYFLIFL